VEELDVDIVEELNMDVVGELLPIEVDAIEELLG